MKWFRQFVSITLAVIMLSQTSITAFADTKDNMVCAEDGVTYTYNTDGTITATVIPASSDKEEPDACGFKNDGQNFTGTYNGLDVEAAGTYSDGSTLVSVSADDHSIAFYPETVGAEDKAVEENVPATEPVSLMKSPLMLTATSPKLPVDDEESQNSELDSDVRVNETEVDKATEEPAQLLNPTDDEENIDSSLAEETDVEVPSGESEVADSIEDKDILTTADTEENKETTTYNTEDTAPNKDEVKIFNCSHGIGQNRSGGKFNSVLYPSAINEFTDVEIISTETGIKENVILRQYTSSAISYVMSFNGLNPVIKNNSIYLYNADGSLEATVSAPYLKDAAGGYNNNIEISLTELSGGSYRLTYEMEKDWLENAQYPVVLDPSVDFSAQTDSWSWLEDNHVSPNNPNHSYTYTDWSMYSGKYNGNEYISYIRAAFPDALKDNSDNVIIKSFKVHTYVEKASSASYTMHMVVGGEWRSNGLTYNTAPIYLPTDNSVTKTLGSTGYVTWDLTKMASNWFNALGQMGNYGFALKADNPSSGYVQLSSSDNNNHPLYYTITYYLEPGDPNLSVTAKGNALNSGTGYLDLSWKSVTGAESYYVAVFNGSAYQYFNVGNVTSWSTKGKGIWPTEKEINSGKYKLHTDGGGADLPCIPAFTYANAGSSYASNLNYYIRVIPANKYGQAPNPENFSQKTAKLPDTISPGAASLVSVKPSDYTNKKTITVSWKGILDYNGTSTSLVSNVGNGHVQYSIDSTNAWKNTSSNSGTGSASVDISTLEDGKHVIYIRGKDGAGNTGASAYAYFYVDRTGPTAPSITCIPDGWTSGNTVSVTWSGISDLNKLDRVEYSIDGNDYVSTKIPDCAYSGYNIDISALSSGEHKLSLRAVDIAGNKGYATSVTIKKDITAPVVETTEINPSSWTNKNSVTFSWSNLSDEHSGMALAWYCVDGDTQVSIGKDKSYSEAVDVSEMEDGEHTLTLHFEDSVGNAKEESLCFYRDTAKPELSLLSPANGSAVNGAVEIIGSVNDTAIKTWKVIAVGEDGKAHVLNTGASEVNEDLLGVLNCSDFSDGESVSIKIEAWDEAGNKNVITGSVIIVDKSAQPIDGTVSINSPVDNATIRTASITGKYSVDYSKSENKGYLYIDGVYAGKTAEKKFPFEAITYKEGSSHSISILSEANDGTIQFCNGLSSVVLLSDSFEDTEYKSSGNVKYSVLSLRLEVIEDKPAGSDIKYYYSTDKGSSWNSIEPNTDVPLLEKINTVRLKAEATGGAVLNGWTLKGVIETEPLTVAVKLCKDVKGLSINKTTVTNALTTIADKPKNTEKAYQYVDGDKSEGFVYDARPLAYSKAHSLALISETKDGVLYGNGANSTVVLRENVNASGTIERKLKSDKALYALRLEELSTGNTAYYYSLDNDTWTELVKGDYTILESPAKTVYIKAVAKSGKLLAWHIDGVSLKTSNIKANLISAPQNVTAADWSTYYANKNLWCYELSWTNSIAADNTAKNSIEYEIYRNGVHIATTADTRYTDSNYIAGAEYTVRAVRSYGEKYDDLRSGFVAATVTQMQPPERVVGVNYTAEEQAQSEYLNKLYGGNYTFSNEDSAPTDSKALDQSLLGSNKLCARGFEPINFNTGNFILQAVDGSWAGYGLAELGLIRTYNAQSSEADGFFGAKWATQLSQHLTLYKNGDVAYRSAEGAETIFRFNQNGSYSGGEVAKLSIETANNEYRITSNEENITYVFTGAGLLKAVEYIDGSSLTISRDENGFITQIELSGAGIFEVECDKNAHITKITTPGGSTLTYTYKGNNLASFTDAAGNTTKYVYDGNGRMTEWYDADGNRQVRNTYDSEDRVVKQLDANGGEYSIDYYDDHTATTDAEGNVSEVWFDEQKRTTKTVDALGNEVSYDYDAYSNIIAITDENGDTTSYEYDTYGRKTKEVAPDGTFFTLEYDKNGNLIKQTDQNGNATEYVYSSDNCLIKQINPDGGVTEYEYNSNKQVTCITDAMGNKTVNNYDGNNLVSTVDANGNETQYAYDSENRLVETTDAEGNVTAFAYDQAGNLTDISFADGSTFTYAYNAMGKLLSATDALGNVTEYKYDALGNLLRTADAENNVTSNTYDGNGNAIEAIDANGNKSTAEYDALGNILSATDALGNKTEYAYDPTGNLTEEINALGGKTSYAYNEAGLLVGVTTPDGEKTTYTYDKAGNKLTETAPNGGVTSYEYDPMGRNTAVIDANGNRTEYVYNVVGQLTKAIDASGNTTEYVYDAVGNLLSVTDAVGNTTEYAYNSLGQLVKKVDANGAETQYSYDCVGNLISETDANGNVTEYEYDVNGSITALSDALNGKASMEYDTIGNVISVLQTNGGTVSAEYDSLGNLLSETDALGNTTSYEYNAVSKVTKIIDSENNEAETEYDALGNVISVIAPDGGETSFEYNNSGKLISKTDPVGKLTQYSYTNGYLAKTTVNGNETSYEYDLAGNIVSATDAEGRRVEFTYDCLNNLTEVIYPDGIKDTYEYNELNLLVKYTPRTGEVTKYSYDNAGNVVSKNVGGQVTKYEYDLLGRMTAVITADGARTEYSYDALGNVVAETDALGNTTEYGYTVDGLLNSISYANGSTVKAKYDLAGNLVEETDTEGNATEYAYDAVGRITAVTDALGNVTEYGYDSSDNLTQITDALGQVTSYTYDLNGNLTSETDALGNVTEYTYTIDGLLETVVDAEGKKTRYTYDKTGNALSADFAGEQQVKNSYNEIGKLTSVTTEAGATEYQYNEQGYLISVTEPDGNAVKYTYDSHGNRSSMTYPDGKTVKYKYDEMNRLISVKGTDRKVTKYEYDLLGQRISTKGKTEKTSYSYDEVGNLVSQTSTGGYSVSLDYAYDLSGRMISENRTENGTALESSYIYDALGQLTEFKQSNGYSENYSYDAVGNMSAKTVNGIKTNYTYNAANQLISDGTSEYSYDANGNLVEKSNDGGVTYYTYNAMSLLENWTDGSTSENYSYNASGLLSSVENNGVTTELTWDILYGDGEVIESRTNEAVTDYTYGLERISAMTDKTRTEYVYDGRGSVAAELSYETDWYTLGGALSEKSVITKSYTPFGEQLTEESSGFGYDGEYYNSATGTVYLRARFYEPEMNRFSQKDIVRGSITNPNSLNRYSYVQNDPINFVDPSGQLFERVKSGWNKFTTKVKSWFTPTPKEPKVDAVTGAAPYVPKPQPNSNSSAQTSPVSTPTSSPPYSTPNNALSSDVPKVENTGKDSVHYCNIDSGTVITASKVTGATNTLISFLSNSAGIITKHSLNSFKSAKHLLNQASIVENYSKLNTTIPVVGAVADFALQVVGGEGASHAVIKTSAHALIGIIAAAAVPALITAAVPAAIAGGIVAVGASIAFDKVYDNKLRYEVDELIATANTYASVN